MYKISKEFHFCASHRLEGLRADHPCSRLHGHNYVVTVELESNYLNQTGFVVDYRDLDSIKNWIDNACDHKHLVREFVPNEGFKESECYILGFNPTAENMAFHFHGLFTEILATEDKANVRFTISAVTVSETPKTMARYERP